MQRRASRRSCWPCWPRWSGWSRWACRPGRACRTVRASWTGWAYRAIRARWSVWTRRPLYTRGTCRACWPHRTCRTVGSLSTSRPLRTRQTLWTRVANRTLHALRPRVASRACGTCGTGWTLWTRVARRTLWACWTLGTDAARARRGDVLHDHPLVALEGVGKRDSDGVRAERVVAVRRRLHDARARHHRDPRGGLGEHHRRRGSSRQELVVPATARCPCRAGRTRRARWTRRASRTRGPRRPGWPSTALCARRTLCAGRSRRSGWSLRTSDSYGSLRPCRACRPGWPGWACWTGWASGTDWTLCASATAARAAATTRVGDVARQHDADHDRRLRACPNHQHAVAILERGARDGVRVLQVVARDADAIERVVGDVARLDREVLQHRVATRRLVTRREEHPVHRVGREHQRHAVVAKLHGGELGWVLRLAAHRDEQRGNARDTRADERAVAVGPRQAQPGLPKPARCDCQYAELRLSRFTCGSTALTIWPLPT